MRIKVFKPRDEKISKKEHVYLTAFSCLLKNNFKDYFKSYKTVYIGLFWDGELENNEDDKVLGQFTNYRTAIPSDNAIRFMFNRTFLRNGKMADIQDTFLHEIAHALHSQSPTYKHEMVHGKQWRWWCWYLGCTPRATAQY